MMWEISRTDKRDWIFGVAWINGTLYIGFWAYLTIPSSWFWLLADKVDDKIIGHNFYWLCKIIAAHYPRAQNN